MKEEEIRPIAENYVEEYCHLPDGEYTDESLVCAGIGTALIVSRQLEKRIEELTEWLNEASDGKLKLQMLRADLVSKIGNQKKLIEELEEKISILLSCKNCPDNKGGLLCQKEYEDKCLAQKIQFIKELEKENAELLCQKNRNKSCYSCANATERCFRNEIGCPCQKYKSYTEENAELKKKNLDTQDAVTMQMYTNKANKEIADRQLTKAKEIIKYLCGMVRKLNKPNVQLTNVDYSLSEAEQFLKEVKE